MSLQLSRREVVMGNNINTDELDNLSREIHTAIEAVCSLFVVAFYVALYLKYRT